jgi:uncharacterized protein with NRDE domain
VCLVVLAWRANVTWPLVIAGNRDEFYARATLAAQWWDDAPGLVGGRDLVGGGTWMGCTRSGRLALLTNHRAPDSRDSGAPTRGRLVSQYLTSRFAAQPYWDGLEPQLARYNGFHLILGEHLDDLARAQLLIGSNRDAGHPLSTLPEGVHGLSNAALDTPWPKVRQARQRLLHLMGSTDIELDELINGCVDAMHDEQVWPDAMLPETGVPLEWERALSAAFIRTPAYGTRATTVLAMHVSGALTYHEVSYSPAGDASALRYSWNY